jgi:alpha-tubulin suppressor-like RCC1 family protein
MKRKVLWLAFAVPFACSDTGRVLGPPLGSAGRSSEPAGGAPPDAGEPPDSGAPPELGPLVASRLASGFTHTCALFSGRAACWGENNDGQLGVGDTNRRSVPVLLKLNELVALTLGQGHSCALDEHGQVFCWGANDRGQLGIGSRDASSVPVLVPLTGRASKVSTGFAHTCVVLTDGSLWCFGQNGEGELGQNDPYPGNGLEAQRTADELSPVQVPGSYRTVDCGQGHTCGVRTDNSLWCWGRNSGSQLGVVDQIQIRRPVRVGSDADWQTIEAGQQHTCALRTDRSLWCWGENTASSSDEGFPLGVDVEEAPTPTRVGTKSDWLSASTGSFHTCAVDTSFALFCWGRNVEGQLGLGDTELRRVPSPVGAGFSGVAVGGFHTCALRPDGSILCAGKNDVGQLGSGDFQNADQLALVEPP